MIREKQSASIRSIEKDRGISNVLKFIRIDIKKNTNWRLKYAQKYSKIKKN